MRQVTRANNSPPTSTPHPFPLFIKLGSHRAKKKKKRKNLKNKKLHLFNERGDNKKKK